MISLEERFQLLGQQIYSKSDLEQLLEKIPGNYNIYDLSRKNIIQVIKKDARYLNTLSPKLANPFVLGATYCDYRDYMFGGLALYNRYGFTTQVANNYTIYSTTLYGKRKIITTNYNFKKVKKEMIYGYKERMIDGIYVRVMTPERAFIEYCRENRSRKDVLKTIYQEKIDKILFQKLLRKYPYQNIRTFIQQEVITCI